MTKDVLILGASGHFGSHAARAFQAAGWQVRRFQRGTDMTAAAQGASVIVNGLNPPAYHNWAKLVPQITAEVIAAGLASGARVIVPGNVYVYGEQPGVWRAETPHLPNSRKGQIRAEMEAAYARAAQNGLRVMILRGGDFIDPPAAGVLLNAMILRSLARGKITAGGSMTAHHAYAPLTDMARAMVALAELPDLPDFVDMPFAGLNFTLTELKAELERQLNRSLKTGQFPWWLMRVLSPVWELARELSEMRYLNNHSHSLDEVPLQRLLPGFQGMTLAEIVAAHLAHHGKSISTQTG